MANRPDPGEDGPWEWVHGPPTHTEDAHGARTTWDTWCANRPRRGPTAPAVDPSDAQPPENLEAARPGRDDEWPRERDTSPPVVDPRWVSKPTPPPDPPLPLLVY